jgi:hypothetical protein
VSPLLERRERLVFVNPFRSRDFRKQVAGATSVQSADESRLCGIVRKLIRVNRQQTQGIVYALYFLVLHTHFLPASRLHRQGRALVSTIDDFFYLCEICFDLCKLVKDFAVRLSQLRNAVVDFCELVKDFAVRVRLSQLRIAAVRRRCQMRYASVKMHYVVLLLMLAAAAAAAATAAAAAAAACLLSPPKKSGMNRSKSFR